MFYKIENKLIKLTIKQNMLAISTLNFYYYGKILFWIQNYLIQYSKYSYAFQIYIAQFLKIINLDLKIHVEKSRTRLQKAENAVSLRKFLSKFWEIDKSFILFSFFEIFSLGNKAACKVQDQIPTLILSGYFRLLWVICN